MAALETGIRDAILASASIAGLVGARVRPLSMSARDARPYLTYQVTGRETQDTLADGASEYVKGEFEIGIFGDTYDDVMALSTLLSDLLNLNGSTVSNVEFAPVMFDGETDVEQVTPEGETKPIFLRVQTYKVLYRLH